MLSEMTLGSKDWLKWSAVTAHWLDVSKTASFERNTAKYLLLHVPERGFFNYSHDSSQPSGNQISFHSYMFGTPSLVLQFPERHFSGSDDHVDQECFRHRCQTPGGPTQRCELHAQSFLFHSLLYISKIMFSCSVSELKKVFEEAVRQDLGMNRYFNMNTKEVLLDFPHLKG